MLWSEHLNVEIDVLCDGASVLDSLLAVDRKINVKRVSMNLHFLSFSVPLNELIAKQKHFQVVLLSALNHSVAAMDCLLILSNKVRDGQIFINNFCELICLLGFSLSFD